MTGRLALPIGEFQVKPDRIQAVRLTRENVQHAANWCGGRVGEEPKSSDPTDVYVYLIVPTIDGNVSVNIGDWVIRFHNKGSFAGMTDENFQRKYQQTGVRGDNPFPRERARGYVAENLDTESSEGSVPESSGHIRESFDDEADRTRGRRPRFQGRKREDLIVGRGRPGYIDSVIEPSRVRDGDEMPIQSTISEGWRDASYGDTNLGETRGS